MLNLDSNMSQQQIIKAVSSIPTNQLAFSYFPAYIGLMNPNYRFAKHHSMIAEHLMKVEAGMIRRLIVNMPPRHGKTYQIAELFSPWYLGRNPTSQIIYATYSNDRANDVGRKVRNYMIDPLHPRIFKGCSLSLDSKGAHRLATQQGGLYYSVGVGSGVVGRGANLFIIDDPIKGREEADSEAYREKLLDWFRGVAYTRLMPDNAIIVVQTRWHYADLTGFLIEELGHENWTILSLPAICEEPVDELGRTAGEALWPTDYPIQTLEVIKETVGTREWNAQYQQRPLPSEGGMVQLDWFKKYDYGQFAPIFMAMRMGSEVLPDLPFDIYKIAISWDTAFKETQLSDPSAATVWGITKQNDFYLLDIINKQLKYPDLKKTVIELWEKYMRFKVGAIPVIIEDKASGQSLIQDLMRYTKIPVIKVNPEANKQVRMSSTSPLIEAGRVYLPQRSPWLVEYETQIARFPLWKYDDLVDSTSQFLGWVAKPKFKFNPKKRFWK